MKLRLQQCLAFVTAVLTYRGRTLTLEQVLVDTGSASTLFAIDSLQAVEVQLEPLGCDTPDSWGRRYRIRVH